MHALVTGGAGFIGSNLSKKLLHKEYKVTVVDNLFTGKRSNIPTGCNFINDDLRINGFSKRLPDDVTHVFHLAAQSSGEISFEDPRLDLETNVASTIELLDWAKRISVRKFLYTSSMSVYGNVPDKPISENQEISPRSFYAVGKAASEFYIDIYSRLGLDSVILRLFNIYGPGQDIENMKQGMLSIYLGFILNREPLLVKGSMDRFRDFVYIDDCVEAIIASAEADNTSGIFNICSGKKTTVKEAIGTILEKMGEIDYEVINEKGTPGDQFGIFGNPEKTTNSIGWRCKTSFSDGIESMIRSLKGN